MMSEKENIKIESPHLFSPVNYDLAWIKLLFLGNPCSFLPYLFDNDPDIASIPNTKIPDVVQPFGGVYLAFLVVGFYRSDEYWPHGDVSPFHSQELHRVKQHC